MNSKQRVNSVLKGRSPDRTPIGFFAIDSDIAEKVLGRPTYWRAKARCQIAFWQGRRDEVVQSWIADAKELYEKLDIIDILPFWNHMAGPCPPKGCTPEPPRQIEHDTWEGAGGQIYKFSPSTNDITLIRDPAALSKKYTIEDVLREYNAFEPDESIFEAFDSLGSHFSDSKFILGPYHSAPGWLLLGGMERGFMEIAVSPDMVVDYYRILMEKSLELDRLFVRKFQDGVLLGTDFASNKGAMISPSCYMKMFAGPYRNKIANLKKLGQFVIQHACGNNSALLDAFKYLDIDCYQSIQKSAGMDIFALFDMPQYDFSLWGGVQVETLINGEPADVRREVAEFMNRFNGQTGVILGTSHSIAVGTKYDNFMALLDEYCKWV
jgi:hypothetical protein